MNESFDELLAELSRVVLALDDLGDGDADARPALAQRRDELRAILRGVDLDEHRPTAELVEERQGIETRLAAARDERVKKTGTKYLGGTQTVGGGVVPVEINRMIDEGNRFEELLARYERLTDILESRQAL